MKEPTNFSDIFSKIRDLKELFQFGEKIVPIFQSLIEFMKDIVPLMEKVNKSIAESTHKMPSATNQIDSVTSATELATTEILDRVDSISNALSEIEKEMGEILEKRKEKEKISEELQKQINFTNEQKELLLKLYKNDDIDELLSVIKEKLSVLNEESYQITLALQVQDITTQQLAAVNHLIESVNNKLSSLVDDIHKAEIKEKKVDEIEVPDTAIFDPNARYDKDETRQQNVDDIIDEENRTNEIASQDEIDKLFSGE
jgi:chemotaxis regulatin CheY-phosphate phosphatase CheZ